MPADLNRVTLVGRLTRDPEMRSLPSGDPIMSMRLAVSSRQRDPEGQWGDKSNYFDVTLFGRRAEALSAYLAKGSRVGIDGRLSWREWQAQDGSKRQSVEIIANDLFMLDGRREQSSEEMVGAGVGGGADDSPF